MQRDQKNLHRAIKNRENDHPDISLVPGKAKPNAPTPQRERYLFYMTLYFDAEQETCIQEQFKFLKCNLFRVSEKKSNIQYSKLD